MSEKVIAGVVGGALAGIFVGALTYEMINRYYPDLRKNLGKKMKGALSSVSEAFKEGYAGVAPEEEPAAT